MITMTKEERNAYDNLNAIRKCNVQVYALIKNGVHAGKIFVRDLAKMHTSLFIYDDKYNVRINAYATASGGHYDRLGACMKHIFDEHRSELEALSVTIGDDPANFWQDYLENAGFDVFHVL